MHVDGFNNKTNFIFSIREKSSGRFAGCCGIHIDKVHNRGELGYWIAEPLWNKGIATEAVCHLIQFAFDRLKLHKVMASHFTFNPASGRVMQKCGMVQEATLKDHILKNSEYITLIQYGLTTTDYKGFTSAEK